MAEYSESARFAARLSLHEFLLEQLFANITLATPDGEAKWEEMSASIISAFQNKAWPAGQGQQEVQEAATLLAERFCEKVRMRVQNQ